MILKIDYYHLSIMRKKIQLVVFTLLLSIAFLLVFYFFSKSKRLSQTLIESRRVQNETEFFFNLLVNEDPLREDQIESFSSYYVIDKSGYFHYFLYPKHFENGKFPGFVIYIDSISGCIEYAGLYKP